MKHAEHLETVPVLKHPAHKTPLHRYESDKNALLSFGIPPEEIDRIYRALFVHSSGIF